MQTSPSERAARESEAYDQGDVQSASYLWHARAYHVLVGPNTARGEQLFTSLMREHAGEGRVLDVGCGPGELSAQLHEMGARRVFGFDVSHREVEAARASYGELPGVEFQVRSAEDDPLEEQFDLIVGRSVLHHVAFRGVLGTLYERNLVSGGRMVFMEPMSHPLTVLFHRFVRSAHTEDEWPLRPRDVAWMKQRLGARIHPINFLSFPAGALSTHLFAGADNALMRVADRVDRSLERRPRLHARGRQGVIWIDKP